MSVFLIVVYWYPLDMGSNSVLVAEYHAITVLLRMNDIGDTATAAHLLLLRLSYIYIKFHTHMYFINCIRVRIQTHRLRYIYSYVITYLYNIHFQCRRGENDIIHVY